MRLPVLIIIALILIASGLSFYIYQAIRRHSRDKRYRFIFATIASLFIASLLSIFFMPVRTGSDKMLQAVMWILYSFLSFLTVEIVFVLFDCLAWLCDKIYKKNRTSRRWPVLSIVGAGLSLVIFVLMWWGALFNRYHTDVRTVDVNVTNLPPAFEGFRIAQISDLHLGSYNCDTTYISQLVDRINTLHPDLIVFTGDIVNRRSEELTPFVPVLKRLNAPFGVYSIMGNHDYGDYVDWANLSEKISNLDMLKIMQKSMGWHMLNNEHDFLVNKGDTLVLIGVENVGDPPFHTYGDLAKSYSTLGDSRTKILLSHNPAHWHNDIRNKPDTKIDLTLSGHTHAMQIELLGISPAALRYNEWGGLYDDSAGHLLYVNIGIGTVAMPARIGATPELTLLILRNK